MRMPRVRFTVRGMLIAVAVVGATLRIERLSRLSDRYWAVSLDHQVAALEARNRAEAPITFNGCTAVEPGPKVQAPLYRLRDYHDELARKYDRASRSPWLPVAPDPPEPE